MAPPGAKDPPTVPHPGSIAEQPCPHRCRQWSQECPPVLALFLASGVGRFGGTCSIWVTPVVPSLKLCKDVLQLQRMLPRVLCRVSR